MLIFASFHVILFLHSISGSDCVPNSSPENVQNPDLSYRRQLTMNRVKYSPDSNAIMIIQTGNIIPDSGPEMGRTLFSRSHSLVADPRLETISENIHPARLEARSSPRGFFERRSVFSSGLFNRPMLSHWNQRFKDSFSNAFSSILPSHHASSFQTPQATSSSGFFAPFGQQRYPHGTGSPFMNFPAPSNQHFVGIPPFQAGAASFGQPQFMPFQPNSNMGPPFMTSGSTLMPQRFQPPVDPNFLKYVKSIPKHTQLFNNGGGMKGAALEMKNAFADFTDSSEHGPEVTQKFGSVGHTISTFLDMMGLGPAGGITDDAGEFGRGGDWASMDDTPVARSSLDFYPGYGNQANLDDVGDFPIFFKDITEQFLTKMNLTDVIKKVKENESSKSKVENVKNEKPPKETEKTQITKVLLTADKMAKHNLKIDMPFGQSPTISEHAHISESMKGSKTMMSHKKEQKHGDQYLNSNKVDKKEFTMVIPPMNNKIQPTNKTGQKESSTNDNPPTANKADGKGQETPSVNYRIPSVFTPVAPKDRKKPIAIYKKIAPEFPHENDNKVSENVAYAPAHPMSDHESEMNQKLINDDVVRQWVSVTEGKNYVEKHPKPIIDFVRGASEQPKGLTILKEVLSGKQSHSWTM